MPNHSLPVDSEFFKGELYQQMQDDLQLAGMAQRTVAGYLPNVQTGQPTTNVSVQFWHVKM